MGGVNSTKTNFAKRLTKFLLSRIIPCIVLCLFSTALLTACSTDDGTSNNTEIQEESRIKYADEGENEFQQLFETNDLSEYDQVEVGIGSLDCLDTSLVYVDASIQDIAASDLEQGVIGISHSSGSDGSSYLSFIGYGRVDDINQTDGTVRLSHYGSTITNAVESEEITLKLTRSRSFGASGKAHLDDLKPNEMVAFEFKYPQETNTPAGAI